MTDGFYSVAYLQDERERGNPIHWYVWAAWTTEPAGKPWTTPLATGRVRHSYDDHMEWDAQGKAETQADDALRAVLGEHAATRRIDDSFARAAYREAKGAAPNWRAPRPTKYRYAPAPGFSRSPAMPAREFFAAAAREQERAGADFRERLRDFLCGRANGTSDALSKLGLREGATAADIQRAYRRLALKAHPDHGGSSAAFIELTAARDRAIVAAR